MGPEANQSVIDELEEIRVTGACNMMDSECVCYFADLTGYDNVHDWCKELSRLSKWDRAAAWMSALRSLGK